MLWSSAAATATPSPDGVNAHLTGCKRASSFPRGRKPGRGSGRRCSQVVSSRSRHGPRTPIVVGRGRCRPLTSPERKTAARDPRIAQRRIANARTGRGHPARVRLARGGRGARPDRRARAGRRSPAHVRPPDRRRRPPDPGRGARARPAQGPRRHGGQAPPRRGQPAARDQHGPRVLLVRRAAARPDPGGQHGPHARGREVRPQPRLQALHVRHLVDPPVDVPRDRRPGAHDPPAAARARRDQEAAPGQPPADAAPRPRAAGRRAGRRAEAAGRARHRARSA